MHVHGQDPSHPAAGVAIGLLAAVLGVATIVRPDMVPALHTLMRDARAMVGLKEIA